MSSTWLPVADDDPFGVANLPYGTARWPDGHRGLAVRIGNQVLDVGALGRFATFDALLAAGREAWTQTRTDIRSWFTDEDNRALVEPHLYPLDSVRMELPFTVGDYVDFYASVHHATNVGRLFRPDGDPLPPNWKHLPIGYHGRAGTVVPSGTAVVRPNGQRLLDGVPAFGPSLRLDFEAEVAFVVGVPSGLGRPVPVTAFRDHVFGLLLLNDWSARDIQSWEYVPLGPFLGKSFATSVSPWVTPLDALDLAWTDPPQRDVPLLPYLRDDVSPSALDLQLEIRLNGQLVSHPQFSDMYWTPAQMLAHMTVNGASVRTGDLYASGTVSGPQRDQLGCLLELGTGFLEDGDEVIISATAPGPHGPLALGAVSGRVAGPNTSGTDGTG